MKFASLERRVGESLHFANDISLLPLRIYPLLKILFFTFSKLLILLIFIGYQQDFSQYNLLIGKKFLKVIEN